MYEYKIKEITKVVDGDTVYLVADMGFYIDYRVKLRIEGIDAPEVRGAEKEDGKKVKAFAERILENHASDMRLITTGKPDKYGRWLGDIHFSNGQQFGTLVEQYSRTL